MGNFAGNQVEDILVLTTSHNIGVQPRSRVVPCGETLDHRTRRTFGLTFTGAADPRIGINSDAIVSWNRPIVPGNREAPLTDRGPDGRTRLSTLRLERIAPCRQRNLRSNVTTPDIACLSRPSAGPHPMTIKRKNVAPVSMHRAGASVSR